MIDARDEAFFVVDSETLDTSDTSVIMDFSMVFVNMSRIHDLHKEYQGEGNFKPLPYNNFIQLPHISKVTVFPDLREQLERKATIDSESVRFWQKQKEETNSQDYKDYITKMFSKEDKPSVRESIDQIEDFISYNLAEVPKSTQSNKDVFFLERSGGFDTNKYYQMVRNEGLQNDFTRMKYYRRREIRTIISANRWRLPHGVITPNTTNWSDGAVQVIEDSMKGEFIPHIAINDCLIDAYMLYLLKLSVDNFYI